MENLNKQEEVQHWRSVRIMRRSWLKEDTVGEGLKKDLELNSQQTLERKPYTLSKTTLAA